MSKIAAALFVTAVLLLAILPSAARASDELSVSIEPEWINSRDARELTLSFANPGDSLDAVNEIRILKPASNLTSIACESVPYGWDLASPFGSAICAYATSSSPIGKGSEIRVKIKASFGGDPPYNLTIVTKDNGTVDRENAYRVPIKLDEAAPKAINLTAPAGDSWYKESAGVYVSVSAQDDESGIAACSVSIDPFLGVTPLGSLNYSSSGRDCKGIVNLPRVLGEGKHILVVSETDLAGNSNSKPVEIQIDNTPPAIGKIEAKQTGKSVAGFVKPGAEISIRAEITDAASGFSTNTMAAKLDSLTGNAADAQVNPSYCDASSCSWRVFASSAGKSGERAPITVFGTDRSSSGSVFKESSVAFDAEAPVIIMRSPDLPALMEKNGAELSFSVQDETGGSGVDAGALRMEVDGKRTEPSCVASLTCNAELSGLADGPHTATIRAADNSGNEAVPWTAAFTVDTTPPVIGKLSATFKMLNGFDSITLSAQASDATTPVRSVTAQLKRSNGDTQTVELKNPKGSDWEAVFRPAADLKSSYAVEVSAVDGAGNVQKSVLDANLFQIVVVGMLAHIFAAILLILFLYWAYAHTVKKHNLVAHYDSYVPETLGQKLEVFWFNLKGKLSGKKEKQLKL